MAKKEEQPAEEATETPASPSKKKKIIILGIAALLILALVGGAAALLLKKPHPKDEAGAEKEEAVAAQEEEKAKKEKEEKRKKSPPVFAKLDTFTVNLVQETGDQYLQVAITLELEDATADTNLKASMPKIRDGIIRLLGSKKASELATTEGKDELAGELKDTLNELLVPQEDAPKKPKKGKKKKYVIEGPVLSVLFTDFIIQ